MAKKDVTITVLLQDMASGNFRKIEASATSLTSKLGSLKGELMGIAAGAGVTGLAGYMVKAAKDWGNAVDEIVDQTGAAGEEASKLLAIGKRTGMGVDELAVIFARFGRNVSTARDEMAKAATEGKQSNDIFSRLRLTPQDLQGGNLYETYTKIVTKMRELGDAADFDRAAMEIFGRSGWQMQKMLTMTDAEMAKVIDMAQKMGMVISTETAAQWEQFDRNLKSVSGTFSKLGVGIGNELLPRLEELLKSVQGQVDGGAAWDLSNRKTAASAVMLAAEIGGVTVAIKALQAMMATFGLNVVNPWIRLVGIIGAAVLTLYEYNKLHNKIIGQTDEGQNVIKVQERNLKGGWDSSYYVEDSQAPGGYRKATGSELKSVIAENEKGGSGINLPTISGGGGGTTLRDVETGAGSKMQKQLEKMEELAASLQRKLTDIVGTDTEKAFAKLNEELTKAQNDIDEAARAGVDISGVQSVLTKYSESARKQIDVDQLRARRSLSAEISLINAETADDYQATAEAEYQSALVSLEKQKEEKWKNVSDQAAADKWYAAQVAAAQKKRDEAIRDGDLQAYQRAIEHNRNLLVIGTSSQMAVDNLNKKILDNQIAYLDQEIAKVKENSAERLTLEKQKYDALIELENIAGRDVNQATSIALKQLSREYVQWSDEVKSSIRSVDDSFEDNMTRILTGAESFAEGYKNIWNNLINELAHLVIKKWYHDTLQKYMQNLTGGIISSLFGGGGGGSGTASYDTQLNPFVGNNASGTDNWRGGLTWVGEAGPELLNLPKGSSITPMNKLTGAVPVVKLNVINNMGVEAKASQQTTWDETTQTMVVSLMLDAVDRNVMGSRDYFGGLKTG